jgi:hypothetical protein
MTKMSHREACGICHSEGPCEHTLQRFRAAISLKDLGPLPDVCPKCRYPMLDGAGHHTCRPSREELDQTLSQCSDQLVSMQAKITSLELNLATSNTRVSYLEGVLNADGSYNRCHDCGAYAHERDNDWMIDDDNNCVCDECEEKRQDAEGDDHG